jgi:flagellar biosynthesis/type III secretory pathway protein FliH
MKELSLSFGHFKREDELPLTIIVNGCTYQSQPLVDATKKTYFEMGKQHGMKLGSDNTYSDNEMSSMHDAWYDNGYTKGYEAGYEAGIDHGIEKTLQEDRVKEELERTKQTWYAKGKEEGYEAGKWDLPAGDSGVEFPTYKHGWSCGYNEGFEEGKSEGYDEGYEIGKSEYSVKLEERLKSRYISVHIDGLEFTHDGISNKEDYDKGYKVGKEAGKKAYGYSADDIKQINTELDLDQNTAKISIDEHIRKYWYAKGKEEGFEEGKSEGYGKGWIEGHNTTSIKYFDEYSVKLEERLKSRYDDGYNDGYEQCKHDGISKINLNTESVEQTELSKEYDKGFTKGYEEGKSEGYEEGYQKGLWINSEYIGVSE